VAGLSKTFSGDFTGFLAGKLWDEIKRRAEENEIDKRQGDPAVKKAAKELLKDDPKAISVKDPALRERVSMLFGAGLDVKLIRLEDKANELSSSVSTLGTSVADTHKLISDQNEVLEEKFDEILKIFGKENELKKKEKQRAKTSSEELELEEGSRNFGSRALLRAMRKDKGGGGLLGFLARRAGAHIVKRLLRRYIPRRIRARGRMIKGIPGKFRRNLTSSIIRRIPGPAGKKIRNIVLRETAEGVAKRGIGKQLLKQGGKVGTKKIPAFGWIAGAIFAVERALKGDYEGAGLELLSGVAGSIPTVGTGASLGIDSYIITRDIEKGNSYESGTKNAFTKKGPGMLHGQELRLTKGDRDEVMDGFLQSLNTMGAMLTSVALTVAQSAGAETDVKSQMMKDGLDYSKINITFNSDLGRVKTTSHDIEKEDLFMGGSLPSFLNMGRSFSSGINPLSNLLSNLNPLRRQPPSSTNTGGTVFSTYTGTHHPEVRPDNGQPGADFTPKNGMNRAMFPGTVVDIDHDYDPDGVGGDNEPGVGYGNYVVIRSLDPQTGQEFDGLYAHFPDGALKVGIGDTVEWGDELGRMGVKGVDPRERIGSTTAPHTSLDFFAAGSWNTPYVHYKRLISIIDPTFKTNPSVVGKGTGGTVDRSNMKTGPVPTNLSDSEYFWMVYKLADQYGATYPEIAAAQSMHETRWMDPNDKNIFNASGRTNAFGQKGIGDRGFFMDGPNQWAKYSGLEAATEEHVRFWHKVGKGKKAENYNAHLTRAEGLALVLPYYSPDLDPDNMRLGFSEDDYAKAVLKYLRMYGFDPLEGTGQQPAGIAARKYQKPKPGDTGDKDKDKDKVKPKSGDADWAKSITENFGIRKGDSFEFKGPKKEVFRATRRNDGWEIDKLVVGWLGQGTRWERVTTWGKDNNNKWLKSIFIKAGQDRILPKATLGDEQVSLGDTSFNSTSTASALTNKLDKDSFEMADLMEKAGSGGFSVAVIVNQPTVENNRIHITRSSSSNNSFFEYQMRSLAV